MLRAAEEQLDVVLDRESDAAPDLLADPRALAVGLAREQLGHRGEPGDRAALRVVPRRLVDERAAAVDPRRRVGHVVRERLERAERLVELLARLGVLDGDLERAVGAADRLRREQDDPLVQRRAPGGPTRTGRAD